MNHESLKQRYPEREPDLALFSLEALYELQPVSVRRAEASRLKLMLESSKAAVRLIQLEQKERAIGLEKSSEDFAVLHEAFEEVPDDDLTSMIDEQRDRQLTLMAHRMIVTSRYGLVSPNDSPFTPK